MRRNNDAVKNSGIALGFPGGSDGKASAYNVGDLGSIHGSGRHPGGGNGNPLLYSCLENSMERSLVGYSPWGLKDSETTERLTSFSLSRLVLAFLQVASLF